MLAADQHGLVRTDQFAVDDRGRLRHLARRGMLERLARGVYRVTGAPKSWEQQLQAGVWALGSTAAVSHAAAARLHGFDGFDRAGVEFVVDRACRGRRPAGIECRIHTTSALRPVDIVRVGGLPTTSAVRTILDLARDGARDADVEAAIDSAVRLRLTTVAVIERRLMEIDGPARWGVARLDRMLGSSGGHSVLERRFLELVATACLPTPTPQVVHRRAGRHVARVDFLFEDQGVVVEVSGARGHSSPSERGSDARRRNELQQLGRVVLEFTYEQVTTQPGAVVSTLRTALGLIAT